MGRYLVLLAVGKPKRGGAFYEICFGRFHEGAWMMKELLGQLLETEDVHGVMLFSFEGDVIFRKESSSFSGDGGAEEGWDRFIIALQGVREADLIFEKLRLYIRKTDVGYLVIVMGLFSPAAMVRMSCDMLLPSLRQQSKTSGLRNFFKKKS
jgi:hypothetical protein